MKRFNISIVSFLFLFLLVTISGCKNTSQNTQTTPFVTTLSIANQAGMPTTTFTQGEPISFIISLTNASLSTQEVETGGCSPRMEIYNNNLIYDSGEMCLAILPTPSTILPGQTITAPTQWNQKDNNDQQVPFGFYSAVGIMPGSWITGTGSTITTSQPLPSSKPVYFSIGQ